jgi:hypothetical protein
MSEEKEGARGRDWIQVAVQMVVEALAASPDGLTNVEVAGITGLDLKVSRQKTYITWTILRHLTDSGRVQKDGRIYRLARVR